ncbi:MAG TPA: PEP/pyruvate-binding domain-containing protein, partial [Mycobacteriales bacterium]|nr:PEP/pyruvate-binding domain-containing protein [Mycobacteriales bacterium]
MTDPVLIDLDRCGAYPAQVTGNKAHTLGRLINAGLPVPPGFCLTTAVLENLLATSDIGEQIEQSRQVMAEQPVRRVSELAQLRSALHRVEPDSELTGLLEQHIGPLLKNGPVVVRSSSPVEDARATTWSGVFDSWLDLTSLTDVTAAIRKCWASLFTERVMHYSGGIVQTEMAVIIQRQIAAEWSGVLFTKHPTTGKGAVVEASDGNTTDITSGSGITVRTSLNEGLDLPADLTKALALLCPEIEKVTGGPADVEWAWRQDELSILQARPIVSSASVAQQGIRDHTDFEGMKSLTLGSLERDYARALQKRVWFERACRKNDIDVYRTVYLTYPVDSADAAAAQIRAMLRGAQFLVGNGISKQRVSGMDLAVVLRQLGSGNMVGPGLCTVQVGEVVPADLIGFTTILSDGTVWSEVYEGGSRGVKDGSGEVVRIAQSPAGQLSVADNSQGLTTPFSKELARNVARYAHLLGAELGEARLEWYSVGDRLIAKDVSLESTPISAGPNSLGPAGPSTVSPGTAVGRARWIHDLSTLDDQASSQGISVFSHDDSVGFSARPGDGSGEPLVYFAAYPSTGLIPLIDGAVGFVFARGTLLAHTCIVLRERGVPAVINPDVAHVKDGDRVRLGPD